MKPSQIVERPAQRIIGASGDFTLQNRHDIAALWAAWDWKAVTNAIGAQPYGISHSYTAPDKFTYIAGLPVTEDAIVPSGQGEFLLPAGTYALFETDGPITDMPDVFDAVYQGRAELGPYRVTDGPAAEYYTADFNPNTGAGRIDLLFPVVPL